MDIFVINSEKANSVSADLLKEFEHKNFVNESQKKIHRFTYLMLDRILKEFYNISNRSIVFNENKPVLETNEKTFSLSHSGDYIVIAFSDCNCGVDIEKTKIRDYKKISERMGFNSASLKNFYYNWTKYEAEYKLGGKTESSYCFEIPEYVISCVSKNPEEKYEIYYNL